MKADSICHFWNVLNPMSLCNKQCSVACCRGICSVPKGPATTEALSVISVRSHWPNFMLMSLKRSEEWATEYFAFWLNCSCAHTFENYSLTQTATLCLLIICSQGSREVLGLKSSERRAWAGKPHKMHPDSLRSCQQIPYLWWYTCVSSKKI